MTNCYQIFRWSIDLSKVVAINEVTDDKTIVYLQGDVKIAIVREINHGDYWTIYDPKDYKRAIEGLMAAWKNRRPETNGKE